MRIAVNTRFLLTSKMEGFGWFTYETVKRMVEQHPEDEFIFFFDRKFDQRFVFGDNVTPVVLRPPARHPVLWKVWFNQSVTKALRKYKADVFFSPDGYLSLQTNVRQVPVIHDLNFEHYPKDVPRGVSKYLRKNFPKFAHKADHIITVSNYSKDDISESYGINPEKITVAHNGGSDAFQPLAEETKEMIKMKYSGSQPYFVFVGALHPRKNVKRLFNAFDKFKYHSGSSTKLVIVGEKMFRDRSIEGAYNLMAAKGDVLFTGHLQLDELTKVVGAARSLVFPSYFEGFGIPLIEAMKADCPITCGNLTALPEVAVDAAHYFDPFSEDEMAEALFEIDQNERLRNNLIERGRERSKQFTWDQTANKIWDVLEKYRP